MKVDLCDWLEEAVAAFHMELRQKQKRGIFREALYGDTTVAAHR
jgi:hypothetical protein